MQQATPPDATHIPPPTGGGEPEEPGTSWMWIAAALILLGALGFGGYLLLADSGGSSTAESSLLVGRPDDAPHIDGLVVSADEQKITLRTHDAEPVVFDVTPEFLPNLDIPHAQQHASQGQPTRVYYETGPDGERIAMFFDDAAAPASGVPDDALSVVGTPTALTDTGFELTGADGTVLEFYIDEGDKRRVRAEHIQEHIDVPQLAEVRYTETESGELRARAFDDAPFAVSAEE